MTLDDLVEIANDAVRSSGRSTEFSDRIIVRAVVEALRDVIGKHRPFVTYEFDKILGDTGEKAAGEKPQADYSFGSASGEPGSAPAADPSHANYTEHMNETMPMKIAADPNAVCEWTQHDWEYRTAGCNGYSFHVYSPKYSPPGNKCPCCEKRIKFKSEAAR
jgi:hypothetical protein